MERRCYAGIGDELSQMLMHVAQITKTNSCSGAAVHLPGRLPVSAAGSAAANAPSHARTPFDGRRNSALFVKCEGQHCSRDPQRHRIPVNRAIEFQSDQRQTSATELTPSIGRHDILASGNAPASWFNLSSVLGIGKIGRLQCQTASLGLPLALLPGRKAPSCDYGDQAKQTGVASLVYLEFMRFLY